jgi:hypothetical protein
MNKEEQQKEIYDLAEIWVFEHAHDAFGLCVQDGFVAGHNAGYLAGRNEVIDEAIEVIKKRTEGSGAYTEYDHGLKRAIEILSSLKLT